MYLIVKGLQGFQWNASLGETLAVENGDLQSLHSKATKNLRSIHSSLIDSRKKIKVISYFCYSSPLSIVCFLSFHEFCFIHPSKCEVIDNDGIMIPPNYWLKSIMTRCLLKKTTHCLNDNIALSAQFSPLTVSEKNYATMLQERFLVIEKG